MLSLISSAQTSEFAASDQLRHMWVFPTESISRLVRRTHPFRVRTFGDFDHLHCNSPNLTAVFLSLFPSSLDDENATHCFPSNGGEMAAERTGFVVRIALNRDQNAPAEARK